MSNTVGDEAETTLKEAGIGSALGKVWHGGSNPELATLGRALLLGGAGYGIGRLGTKLFDRNKQYDAHRVGLATALGLMPLAPLGNYNKLMWKYHGSKQPGVSHTGYSDKYMELPTMGELGGDIGETMRNEAQRTRQYIGRDPMLMPKMGAALIKKAFELKLVEKRAYGDRYSETGADAVNMRTFLPPDTPSAGYAFPKHYTYQQIESDPYLSPIAKAKAMDLIDRAGKSNSGLISWGDVAKGGVGTIIGYQGAKGVGKVLSAIYGGIPRATQKRLQQVGAIAGLLMNTGALR